MCTYFFSLSYVNIIFYVGFLISASDLQIPRLEISTVGARYEFPVCIIAWEPCLQIILFGSCIIQSSRYNIDNLIRKLESLHELLGNFHHLFVHFPRVLWFCNHELFNFLELMDSENTPSIFPMSTCFLSKACRCSAVLDW